MVPRPGQSNLGQLGKGAWDVLVAPQSLLREVVMLLVWSRDLLSGAIHTLVASQGAIVPMAQVSALPLVLVIFQSANYPFNEFLPD
jgi:hypothetical protein